MAHKITIFFPFQGLFDGGAAFITIFGCGLQLFAAVNTFMALGHRFPAFVAEICGEIADFTLARWA